MVPSGARAIRRGRALAAGSGYSWMVIVFGSIVASLLAPNSQKNGALFCKITDAVWHSVWRWRFRQSHLAGLRIEPPDVVSFFVGEPQNAIVIEYGRVRVDLGTAGWAILSNLTRLWIEFANVTSGDCGEPDVAIFVGDQAVRAGVGRLQRIFLELSSFRIEP